MNNKEAQKFKQLGNEAYKKQDFKMALDFYEKAIKLKPHEITFYNNTAAVYFEMKDYTECVKFCYKACKIGQENGADPKFIAKGYDRMKRAYKELGNLKMADMASEKAQKYQTTTNPPVHLPRAEPEIPELLLQFVHEFVPSLPNFSGEYKSKYPRESNHFGRLCKEEFRLKSIVLSEEKNLAFEGENSPENFQKRWGVMDEKLQSFLKQIPRPGDIFEHKPFRFGKCFNPITGEELINAEQRYQTMRNFMCSDVKYEFEHTYISFGFVDLFQLMFGTYHNTEGHSTRLRYLCFDKCPIILARGLLIWKLLKMPKVTNQTILQVWFSTCWDEQTRKDFRKACFLVLNDFTDDDNEGGVKDALRFIKHWTEANCPKEEALDNWMSNRGGAEFAPVCNLTLEEDRVRYCRYLLTGIIFVDESHTTTGNVSIFSVPIDGKSYKRLSGENLFHGLNINSFRSANENGCQNFMDFVETIIKGKLNTFRGLVQDERIEVKFKYKNISVDDLDFAAEIKELNPYGIEWSNIPDYMDTKKFILFARACSGEDTVHTIDVMNWVRHVFGACWIDYTHDMPGLRKTYSEFKKGLETLYKANWEMMSSVGQPSAKFLKPNLLGFAMNVFDKVVGYKYVDRYVNHFFVNEDGSPINKFFEKSTLMLFNPFSYANQSFHLSLTFNDEIRLRWALA